MFTSTVFTNDQNILPESNLAARHPRRALIMLYIPFNKANEGLVSVRGYGSSAQRARCYPLLYGLSVIVMRKLLVYHPKRFC